MRTFAIVLNVVLLAFTCLVLVTDGFPTTAVYIVLTVLLLVIPILTLIVLFRRTGTDAPSSGRVLMERVVAACNILLLVFVCWAIVDHYPHPKEEGFLAYVVLVIVTPGLSALTLLRGTSGRLLTSTK